jgi:glycosyltransferase involved in cell wall biosynthesis
MTTNQSPHIAIFLPTLGGGGAERVMLNLAEAFGRRDATVEVVVGSAAGELAGAVPEGVGLVDLGAGRIARSIGPLAGYLRQQRPDVLIASIGHANLAALAARAWSRTRTRVVVTEHLAVDAHPTGLGDRAFRTLARWCYPRARAIVAVSHGVAESFAAATRLPRDAIQVVYNPVLTPEFWRRVEARCDHPWFAEGEPPVVIGVGRLAPQKDFTTLIRAFARIRRRLVARLMVLGEGPERAALEREVAAQGLRLGDDVALPGFVADPYPYMAAAGAFVLSSRREGLPTVLIEALASGTRVIATACESGPDEILAGGRYGTLVPVGDVDAMADAVGRALEHPTPTVPEEAWRAYTPDAAADAYLRVAGLEGAQRAP